MKIKRKYNAALRRFTNKTFLFWQRLGVHVTPNHFDQPIPDTRTLKDDLWSRHSDLLVSILMRKNK